MNKLCTACVVVLLVLLSMDAAAADVAASFEVSNIKAGLSCLKSGSESDRDGWVCQPMKDIYVVDQGTCFYDRREQPCTWTGLEFDYRGARPGAKLICSVSSSSPTTLGNPNSAATSGVRQFTYELSLDKPAGHHFEAQYVVFQVHDIRSSTLAQTTQCAMDGRVAFSFEQVFHYPTRGT